MNPARQAQILRNLGLGRDDVDPFPRTRERHGASDAARAARNEEMASHFSLVHSVVS
jgi:hypothetical protein